MSRSGWRAGGVANAAWFSPTIPTFVLPYKRYAGPTLLQLAGSYLDNDQQSYRQTVQPGGPIIGYQTAAEAAAIDERALDRMTVWRTVSWLGGQVAALQAGSRLLHEQDPTSICHRFVGAVAPHKFRSPERQQTLCIARRLLHLRDHWNRTFREAFFPRFATRAGFG